MAYNNILFEVEEGVATITFNRPNVLNALNSELLGEFSSALDEISNDENIRVCLTQPFFHVMLWQRIVL